MTRGVAESTLSAPDGGFFFFLDSIHPVAHDPTQLNRQGNDTGRQYRSAIFYAGGEQRRIAEAYIRQLNEARIFKDPIVTTLEPLDRFYVAEDYHQDYAARNPGQPYILFVAQPKVEKLRKDFKDRLK